MVVRLHTTATNYGCVRSPAIFLFTVSSRACGRWRLRVVGLRRQASGATPADACVALALPACLYTITRHSYQCVPRGCTTSRATFLTNCCEGTALVCARGARVRSQSSSGQPFRETSTRRGDAKRLLLAMPARMVGSPVMVYATRKSDLPPKGFPTYEETPESFRKFRNGILPGYAGVCRLAKGHTLRCCKHRCLA